MEPITITVRCTALDLEDPVATFRRQPDGTSVPGAHVFIAVPLSEKEAAPFRPGKNYTLTIAEEPA